MAEPDKRPVTMEELLVSSLAQTDALAKLLIEKGLFSREEFMQKISDWSSLLTLMVGLSFVYPILRRNYGGCKKAA